MNATIASTSRIVRDSNGNTINLTVLRLTNGWSILRSLDQIKTDLEGSGRLVGVSLDSIQSVTHPALVRALTKLHGGSVSGEFSYKRKGEKYIVTDTMRVITDPSHPEYSKFAVGDQREYSVDQTLVEGFLQLAPSFKQLQAEEMAFASAQYNAELNGLFDSVGISGATAGSKAEGISADDIPTEVLEAAGVTGNAPAEEEEPAEATAPAEAAAPATEKAKAK